MTPAEIELANSVVYTASFDTIWEDCVEVLAVRAPYMFQSEYYAHKQAAKEVGEHMATSFLQKKWSLYVNDKLKGMSNYAGD